eukprot:TRINITY_DN13473_c0_g1_i1.p1 TRINITY_DN13473_c0_g1~~TRINITY_DN13473_c0_g1_i1.p1  ORF type:complete len:228 (+),score=29.93 TRINITY_DN13473_c0_g1_i1:55-738(+)
MTSLSVIAVAYSLAVESYVTLHEKAIGPSVSSATLTALRFTHLHDDMPGWLGLPNSRISNFHKSQDKVPAFVPDYNVDPGSVSFTCASYAKQCEAFVYLYKCDEKCGNINQDLRNSLITEAWVPFMCGPTFTTDTGSFNHKLTIFKKLLEPSETVSVTIDSPVKFVFFALDDEGVDCSQIPESKCEKYEKCRFRGGKCEDDLCPPFTGVPSGSKKCDCCALDDEAIK